MVELISLKLKTQISKIKKSTDLSNSTNIEINGNVQINNHQGGILKFIVVAEKSVIGVSNLPVSDIKSISLLFEDFDPIISWEWENREGDAEIEFTIKNIKYDKATGLSISSNNLFIDGQDLETEEYDLKDSKLKNYLALFEMDRKYSATKTFNEFQDLIWKSTLNIDDENITRFLPLLEEYKNSSFPEKHKLYNSQNIICKLLPTQSEPQKFAKDYIDLFVKKIKVELPKWKVWGIKTILKIERAERNYFNIDDGSLAGQINSTGKYKGFPITHYNRKGIDIFRRFFTTNLDKSDAKYFRGFQPNNNLIIREFRCGDLFD